MRAFFLALIVVVAFLLVLKFYPSSSVEGAEGLAPERPAAAQGAAEEPVDVAGRFLIRPEGSRPAAVEDPPAEPETQAVPDWLKGLEDQPAASPSALGEVRLARAVLDGTPEDVSRLIDDGDGQLSDDRRRLVLAFCEALSGDRSRALMVAQEIGDEAEWREGEQQRLRSALTGQAPDVRPASARSEGPLALAMEMALAAREARMLAATGQSAESAHVLSELLLAELGAPWGTDEAAIEAWSAQLNEAQRQHRWNPHGDWPADELVVEEGDNLTFVRKRYLERHPGRLMCTGLIERANELRGYLQPGQVLRVPTEPVSVIVDLSSRRLLHLIGDEVTRSWEVGIGRQGEETIVGRFVVGEKQKNPSWFPRGQEMVPFGDSRNPLGTRWIAWFRDGAKTGYGFHGTSDPGSIGKAASDGCVRMRNEDVEELFDVLPLGAPILVQE